MMTIWLYYGNAVNKFMSCRTSTTLCMGIDEESANRDGADYGSSLGDVISLITFTGGATRGTVTGTVNGTQIFSHTPTNANTLGANMAIGTAMRLGDGGDLSHVDVIFREGLITNGVASVPDEAAARNNMTTFYGAYSPAACQSTADMSYYFEPTMEPTILTTPWPAHCWLWVCGRCELLKPDLSWTYAM
jgi:hypothetical protein